MTLFVVLALAFPGHGGQAPTDLKLVRIFLDTEDGGHPEELAGRRESLEHLAEALAKRKKLLVVVDKEELADLVLDVRERRLDVPRVVVGIGGRPGQPPGGGGPARTVQLVAHLTWRGEGVDFLNKNKPLESSRGWRSAADDIAAQLEKWIAERRARILSGREPQPAGPVTAAHLRHIVSMAAR
jgi:hypothetical protein